MIQLRHLRYFVKIVEAGSFSRAAATIHVAQPALSQQIAELEEEIGVSLLHRSARGVRPTAAGEVLYREATAILRQMEQLRGIVRSSGGAAEGTVSLGMSSTLAAFLAGPFMEACKAALPGVNLRLVTGDSLLMKGRIEAGTLDLGTVFEDEPAVGFHRSPLFRQRLYLVRREPWTGAAPTISLAEVARLPLILPTHPNVTRILINRVFGAAGLRPEIAVEADVLSSMLSAVQAGMGDAIVPKGDYGDVPGHGALFPIPIDPPLWLTASIVSSGTVPMTRAGEAVRDLFAGFVRRQMAAAMPPGAEWVGVT